MALSEFSKQIQTSLHGKTLRMFLFDMADNEMKEAELARHIFTKHYKEHPPLGFNKTDVENDFKQKKS